MDESSLIRIQKQGQIEWSLEYYEKKERKNTVKGMKINTANHVELKAGTTKFLKEHLGVEIEIKPV